MNIPRSTICGRSEIISQKYWLFSLVYLHQNTLKPPTYFSHACSKVQECSATLHQHVHVSGSLYSSTKQTADFHLHVNTRKFKWFLNYMMLLSLHWPAAGHSFPRTIQTKALKASGVLPRRNPHLKTICWKCSPPVNAADVLLNCFHITETPASQKTPRVQCKQSNGGTSRKKTPEKINKCNSTWRQHLSSRMCKHAKAQDGLTYRAGTRCEHSGKT